MSGPAGRARLRAIEAEALASVTPEAIALFRWPNGAAYPQQREADRALYATLQMLRAAGCRRNEVVAALHISHSRYDRLRKEPISEARHAELEQMERERQARRAAERRAWLAEMRPRWVEEKARRRAEGVAWRKRREQMERDERREIGAQNLACLIECLADLRPYVSLP